MISEVYGLAKYCLPGSRTRTWDYVLVIKRNDTLTTAATSGPGMVIVLLGSSDLR
jgi:hypothetical protein